MKHSSIRYLLLAVLVLVLAGVLGTAYWTRIGTQPSQGQSKDERPLEGLKKSFGTVPDFSLIERSGKPLKLSDLRGKVWIVNFIYTNCTDTCLLQSAEMAKLQTAVAEREDVRLVSISVDPERDTPEALSRYAERFKADPDRWLFLTGGSEEIYRLAQEGFLLSAVPVSTISGVDISGVDRNAVIHSSRFILVGLQGRIRGYYDSGDTEALKRLRNDIDRLIPLPG